jgi:hypothetical protein
MIGAIDQHDVDIGTAQGLSGGKAAESSSDDDDLPAWR